MILVHDKAILGIDPTDSPTEWILLDQIIPKVAVPNATLIDVDVPDDYVPGRYIYDSGFVRIPAIPVVASVPVSVSPRQIREALIDTNLIDAVEAAVLAGDRKLKNWWEFATAFERQNVHVTAMSTALGISDKQLDDLFILAASL